MRRTGRGHMDDEIIFCNLGECGDDLHARGVGYLLYTFPIYSRYTPKPNIPFCMHPSVFSIIL